MVAWVRRRGGGVHRQAWRGGQGRDRLQPLCRRRWRGLTVVGRLWSGWLGFLSAPVVGRPCWVVSMGAGSACVRGVLEWGLTANCRTEESGGVVWQLRGRRLQPGRSPRHAGEGQTL